MIDRNIARNNPGLLGRDTAGLPYGKQAVEAFYLKVSLYLQGRDREDTERTQRRHFQNTSRRDSPAIGSLLSIEVEEFLEATLDCMPAPCYLPR